MKAGKIVSASVCNGVLAALVTPVDDQGRVDFSSFSALIDFVAERGVDGIVVGGATGEYASFSFDVREKLIRQASRQSGGRFAVLAGIGGQSIGQTLSMGRVAAESGCRAVLLPMPYFFRYQQEDLQEYCRKVNHSTQVPCLLYHLPAFTNRLEMNNVIELLKSRAGLAGIKDSSGERCNLEPLAEARRHRAFELFVGDDALALDALSAGWDGVISGIACFLPELLVELAESFRAGNLGAARQRQDDLDEVVARLVQLPIPWAIRIGLEARGIPTGPLPLPLSPQREHQVAAFREWCREWLRDKAWAQPQMAPPRT